MGCGVSTETEEVKTPRADDGRLTVAWQTPRPDGHIVTTQPETPDDPVPPADLDGPTDDPFFNEALWLHNAYRERHHSPPLRPSFELTEYAKHWAHTLARKHQLEYSNALLDSERVGENIYRLHAPGDQEISAKDVCDAWYKEKSRHDFSSDDFIFESGHFTQMIWYDSREFGIARARAEDGTTYIVANYKPPGNVQGDFRKNVFDIED